VLKPAHARHAYVLMYPVYHDDHDSAHHDLRLTSAPVQCTKASDLGRSFTTGDGTRTKRVSQALSVHESTCDGLRHPRSALTRCPPLAFRELSGIRGHNITRRAERPTRSIYGSSHPGGRRQLCASPLYLNTAGSKYSWEVLVPMKCPAAFPQVGSKHSLALENSLIQYPTALMQAGSIASATPSGTTRAAPAL